MKKSKLLRSLFASNRVIRIAGAHDGLSARLVERNGVPSWVSFSCADGRSLRSGEPLREQAARLDGESAVVAVGINCTAPEHVSSLIGEIRAVTAKPVVVYPNSGEGWDAAAARWAGEDDAGSLPRRALEWRAAGATLIGGCCRVGPAVIAAIRQELIRAPRASSPRSGPFRR